MTRIAAFVVAAGMVALAGCGGASLTKVGPVGSAPSVRANGPIAYERYAGASSDDSSAQIFLRTPAGAVRQLTRVPGGAFAPAWSPSGTRIAFERGTSAGRHLIYSMKPDGTDLRSARHRLHRSESLRLDALPRVLARRRARELRARLWPDVHRVDPGSGGPVDTAARVDLMVVDAGGGRRRPSRGGGPIRSPGTAPRWAPDGTRLVLPLVTFSIPTSTRSSARRWSSSTRPEAVSIGSRHGTSAPATRWSPDGKSIVFNSEGGHSRSTYVVRPDGQRLRRLLAGGARLSHLGDTTAPAWSPDGKQIVFTTEPRRCGSLHLNACETSVTPSTSTS